MRPLTSKFRLFHHHILTNWNPHNGPLLNFIPIRPLGEVSLTPNTIPQEMVQIMTVRFWTDRKGQPHIEPANEASEKLMLDWEEEFKDCTEADFRWRPF